MKFNNTENKSYDVDGKTIWASRSVAIHGILVIRKDNKDYLLLTKRSEHCPDEIGKFANVTGYLDWDEDAISALKREYWEEVGLNFDQLISKNVLLYGDLEQPMYVKTDPKASRQNVTLRFGFHIEVDEFPEIKMSKEVSSIDFYPVDKVLDMIEDESQFAWDHAIVIKIFLNLLGY